MNITLKTIFRFLGSLKLAVLLLLVLAFACARGTWLESAISGFESADVAKHYVYNAWWFNGWLVLLCINLAAAAALRYPFKPHHTGFVITHIGIITMLVGGIIDRMYGIEGFLDLRVGQTPSTVMELHEQEFVIYPPGNQPPLRNVYNFDVVSRLAAQVPGYDAGDIRDLEKLVTHLKEKSKITKASPAKRLYTFLDDYTKSMIDEFGGASLGPKDVTVFADALNEVITRKDFYKASWFEGVELPAEAQAFLDRDPALWSSRHVRRLNRLVLAAAFPAHLEPGEMVTNPVTLEHTPDGYAVEIVEAQTIVRSMKDVAPVAEGGRPAILWQLKATMMGEHQNWIFLGETSNLGPASVRFLNGMPPVLDKDKQQADEGSKGPTPDGEKKMVPQHESHLQFALHEGFGTVKQLAGPATGATSKLRLAPELDNIPVLTLTLKEQSFNFPVAKHLGETLPLQGLDDWKIKIVGYFPNFRTIDGKRQTVDEKPENPAVEFELLGPLVEDTGPSPPPADPHGGMAANPHGGHGEDPHGGHGAAAPPGDPTANVLTFYLGPDKRLRYHFASRKGAQAVGEVKKDLAFDTPWVPGAQVSMLSYLPSGERKYEWAAMPENPAEKMRHGQDSVASLGLLCRITHQGKSSLAWVPQSRARQREKFTVDLDKNGDEKLVVMATNRAVVLPFSVSLMKFNAPYEEGLENSSNFMAFESHLVFDGQLDTVRVVKNSAALEKAQGRMGVQEDLLSGAIIAENQKEIHFVFPDGFELDIPKADVLETARASHKIGMNRPTTFPVTFYGPWLGSSYKFSQADHRMPFDPNYSGVQVLRDPGWMPKWVGSLMICFGIFTMFYLKPYFSGRRAWKAEQAAAGGDAEPKKGRKSGKEQQKKDKIDKVDQDDAPEGSDASKDQEVLVKDSNA